MVPNATEASGASDRFSLKLADPDLSSRSVEISKLDVFATDIRLDDEARLEARWLLSTSDQTAAYMKSDRFVCEVRNVGWSDVFDCQFQLVEPMLEVLLGGKKMAFEAACLASGKRLRFEIAHQNIDQPNLQRLYDKKAQACYSAAETALAKDYESHLERVRAPMVNLNDVRRRNYERMTALGRKWTYNPVPVPQETGAMRSQFKEESLDRYLDKAWPSTGAMKLRYKLRTANGDAAGEMPVLSPEERRGAGYYSGKGSVRIRRDEFWDTGGPRAMVDNFDIPHAEVKIFTETRHLQVDMPRMFFPCPLPDHVRLTATQSCWANIVVEVTLVDGTVLRSNPEAIRVRVDR